MPKPEIGCRGIPLGANQSGSFIIDEREGNLLGDIFYRTDCIKLQTCLVPSGNPVEAAAEKPIQALQKLILPKDSVILYIV